MCGVRPFSDMSVGFFCAESEPEERSFVHHGRKMRRLNWEKEPTSVALFIQDRLEDIVGQIDFLKEYLTELGLKVTIDEYHGEDFIFLLGTDRFNLKISSLFQDRSTPPIVSISPKNPGFVSFIEFCSYMKVVPQILRGNCFVLPRCRLLCEYHSHSGLQKFVCLNDLCVNRDPLFQTLVINCSSNHYGFSQIKSDGVIISTSTGSTAYNKAAGGALVHPLLPVFLLTPICALSLSARPIIFPQSANLTIELQETEGHQQKAIFTCDGSGHQELKPGEKLVIRMSPYYFNSIMMSDSIGEWLVRLAGLMGWNERKHQKALPSVPQNQ